MNRILIAEDDESLARMLQKVFDENEFEAYIAEDGKETIRLHQTRNPDIILMDIDMPYRTGWEVLEIIRKGDKTIPIVFMSGKRISEEDSLRSYELGAVSFIRKPFFPKEVVAHIQSLIKIKYDFDETIAMDGYSINLSENTLRVKDEDCYLTEREAKVLYLLSKKANKVVTYQEFVKYLWHTSEMPTYEQMLRNNITRLRDLLKGLEHIHIERIYGKGYILKIAPK